MASTQVLSQVRAQAGELSISKEVPRQKEIPDTVSVEQSIFLRLATALKEGGAIRTLNQPNNETTPLMVPENVIATLILNSLGGKNSPNQVPMDAYLNPNVRYQCRYSQGEVGGVQPIVNYIRLTVLDADQRHTRTIISLQLSTNGSPQLEVRKFRPSEESGWGKLAPSERLHQLDTPENLPELLRQSGAANTKLQGDSVGRLTTAIMNSLGSSTPPIHALEIYLKDGVRYQLGVKPGVSGIRPATINQIRLIIPAEEPNNTRSILNIALQNGDRTPTVSLEPLRDDTAIEN